MNKLKTFAMIGILTMVGASVASAQSPIGQWNFSQQTLANSGTSGSVNDGSYWVGGVSGTPTFSTNTPFGVGYSLDLTAGGVSGAVMRIQNSSSSDASYTGNFDSQLTDFTVACWENRPVSTWQPDAWNVFTGKTADSGNGFYIRRTGLNAGSTEADFSGGASASSSINVNDGKWHHLAMTFSSSSGTLSYYIDGDLVATASGSFTPDEVDPLVFGAQSQAGYRPVTALMNDLRFYNYALSASAVSSLATASPGLPTVIGLAASYTVIQNGVVSLNPTVVGSPVPAIQWYYNGGMLSGATNATLVINSIQLSQQGNYAIVATNSFGSVTNTAAITVLPFVPSLVGHWITGSESLADTSGYQPAGTHDGVPDVANTGTIAYSTDVPAGFPGESLDLTAGNTAVRISNTQIADAGYTNTFDDQLAEHFTVTCWEKFNANNNWNTFVAKNGETTGFMSRRRGVDDYETFTIPGTASGNSNPEGSAIIDDDNWHFIASIWDGIAGTRQVYVDGVLDVNLTNDFGPWVSPAQYSLMLGARDNGGAGNYLQGLLYDVRIYNYALTPAQALSIGAAPGLPVVNGLATNYTVYQGASISLNAAVTANPQAAIQWLYNGAIIPNVTNTTLTLASIQVSQQGNYAIVASNSYGSVTNTVSIAVLPPPSDANPSLVWANHPIGYWRFNDGESTTAYNTTGGNNVFDPLASPLQAGPQPPAFAGFESTNTAPFMDGVSQGYASTVSLFNNRSNFTIMGWFNIDPSQYPFDSDPFTHPNGRASLFGQEWAAELGFYGGNQLYFYATGISQTIFVANGFAAGQWNFVAAVSDSTANTTTVYLNGVAVGTASACPGTVNSYLFSIGKNVSYFPSGGYDNAFFPGSIDEVAAFDHALSPSTIQAIYQAGMTGVSVPSTPYITGISISGATLTITATNGASSGQYRLLESTNIALPLANWVPVLTNNFDSGGNLNLSTNIVNLSHPSEFFILMQ